MKPSLCVINYNGSRYIRETLQAAVENSKEYCEIIVFDNASDDGSPELAESEFPQVQVVRLGENRGPAPARNAALDRAASDRVLIIDNDVRVEPACGTTMCEALDRYPNAAIAMPSVIYAHRPDTVQYDGADNHFLGQQILHSENRPVAEAGEVQRIGSLVTACFIVDRSRLDERFDETFFIYFEDHDFGVRARLYGKDLLSVPQARCLHAEGTEGLSLRQLGKYSSMRVFCIIRNRWLFLLSNYSTRTLLLLTPLFLVYELSQFVMAVKKGWFREWRQAVGWMVTHRNEIRSKRRDVQSRRVIPDHDIMIGGRLPFRRELTKTRIEAAGQKVLDAIVTTYWSLFRLVA